MATSGWEGVTPTDLARRAAQRTPLKAQLRSPQHKFHAEPCIVASDGTLFTTTDIVTAELASTNPRVGNGDGTLKDRAARVGIRGEWFASTKEGRRYLELKLLERVGAISDLRCQVPFDLTVVSIVDGRTHTVGRWTADFEYRRDGTLVIEDVKGAKATRTTAYQLRKKIVEAQYGLRILET